jgi:dimethylsulfide dehydrogenase subunit gamma
MGMSLMKNIIAIALMATIVTACGSSEPDATEKAPAQVEKAAAVVIDDTPVEALAIGGGIRMLVTDTDLQDPENSRWREAQEYSMELGMAPPVHQSINLRYDPTTPAVPVFLRAATDGNKLYLRLRWPDDSKNTATTRTDFADAAAVQFALGDAAADGSPTTSFMMGAADGPVNIWYWKAGQPQAQNLAAGGFGSTTRLDPAGLVSSSTFRGNGEWVVVFSRNLDETGEHLVALGKAPANLALALWQGDQKQRDGIKHVSMGWVTLEPAS